MKKRTIYITLFLIFIIGVISLIGTFAIDSSITEGNSTKADYLFNITLGDRTNREIVIPSYDSKIVDIKISNPNEFNMSYLLYLEGVNSNISIINISNNEASGVLNSKTNTLIKVFIQNTSSSDITTSIKDIVGFEKEKLSVPSNNTSISKGTYYKVIVKSNDNTYGKVKPNIKLSTSKGTVKYTISSNTGYQYKSTTCNGTVSNNILTISNITSNISCEVVFEPKQITVNFDLAGGVVENIYTEPKEHTYTVLYNGTYKLETWGAQGGGVSSLPGGYGGYSAGNIELSQNEKLYVYVGENYNGYKSTLSFNGGGSGTYSTGENTVNFNGGGATDIRLVSGDWNSTASLASRIIIAGGGGGYSNWSTGSKGGSAGGLIGYSGNRVGSIVNSTGGTQVSGGYGTENRTDIPIMGAFGIGGYSGLYSSEWIYNSGGGGGYYGGGAGGAISGSVGSASGGSSYISGHTGCVAIISQNDITPKSGCTTGTTDNSCSIHYSGKKFTNTVMIDGQGYSWTNTKGALQQMPNPSGGYYASGIGNSGNGVARITLMSDANYNVTYNTKYGTLPTPTRSGYTFAGWYTEPDGGGTRVTNDTVLTNTSDHTLYAKWKINNITVTYDGNIFTPSINYKVDNGLTITYDPNTSYLTINGTPTTSGQSLGIMYNLSFTEGEKYASKVTYISGSYNNTGSDGGCFALDVKNSNGVEVSTRNYADLQFTTSSAETILTINSAGASEGDRFQYWLWFNTPADWTFTNYTVKLDLSKIESKTILHGQKYGTMPTPIRTGYTFEGWYTGENGTGTKITSDTVLTNKNNHTLYANWTVNSYYLDLNGMLNGNSSGYLTGYGTADVYINGILVCNDCDDYYSEHPYGTAYSISDIKAITGHTYNGIYSGSANGTIGTSNVSVQLNFSTNTYTISYNANGGSGAPSSQTKTYGVNLTLSSTIPTRSGYTFLGWSESSSATSATYASGGTFTSNKATTLYAVWKLQIVYIYNQGATNTSLVGGWSTIGMRSEYDYQDKRAPSVVYNDTYLSIVQEAGGYGFSGLVYTTNKINLSPYSTLTAKIAYNNSNADYGIFVLDVPNTSDYYVNNSVAKYHVPRASSGGIVTITIDISSISGSYNVALGAVGWSGSNSFYIYELSLK